MRIRIRIPQILAIIGVLSLGAVGVAQIPLGACVEIELIAELAQ